MAVLRSLALVLCAVAVAPAALGCDALSDDDELATCAVPSDCMLAHNACCGGCPPLRVSDVTPVNVRFRETLLRKVCGDGDVDCPPIGCVPTAPTLIPTCEAGRCVAIELAQHPATTCSSNADCRIRAFVCCECNAPTHTGGLIAVSDSAAYEELVCDPSLGCDDCAAIYPSQVTPVCRLGSCVVEDLRVR